MAGNYILPDEVREEVVALSAANRHDSDRLLGLLADAAQLYNRGRFRDSLALSRKVLNALPESYAARELTGLCYYALGKWREAITQLQRVVDTTVDPAQIPTLMDAYRALRDYDRVSSLFRKLRTSSPPADVMAEGRIVFAESLADQGMVAEGISLLEEAGIRKKIRNPQRRHYRQWYALGDLYEKAGNIASARRMFQVVAEHDGGETDARDRLAFIGRNDQSRKQSAAHQRH